MKSHRLPVSLSPRLACRGTFDFMSDGTRNAAGQAAAQSTTTKPIHE